MCSSWAAQLGVNQRFLCALGQFTQRLRLNLCAGQGGCQGLPVRRSVADQATVERVPIGNAQAAVAFLGGAHGLVANPNQGSRPMFSMGSGTVRHPLHPPTPAPWAAATGRKSGAGAGCRAGWPGFVLVFGFQQPLQAKAQLLHENAATPRHLE